ncbi:MAG: hypothetical protein AAF441_26965, partial [Pseudomonadota bacterium]
MNMLPLLFNPVTRAILDADLVNADSDSVLRIASGPQTLSIELANLTDHDLVLNEKDPQTTIVLTFRPGVFENIQNVRFSGNGWKATRLDNQEFPAWRLTNSRKVRIKRGKPHTIKISGLEVSASGGSRSTRVDLDYANLHVPGTDTPVSGRRTMHLSLLHPSVPPGLVAGSRAQAGPFRAEIVGSSDVINGGGFENKVIVRLSAEKAVSVAHKTGEDRDAITKFTLSFPSAPGDRFSVLKQIHAPLQAPGGWTPAGQQQRFSVINQSTFPIQVLEVSQKGALKRSGGPLDPNSAVAWLGDANAQYAITHAHDGRILNVIGTPESPARDVRITGEPELHDPRWHVYRKVISYDSDDELTLDGAFMDIPLRLFTNLAPGLYPLEIKFENVGDRDGKVVLLLNVTAVGVAASQADVVTIHAPKALNITSRNEAMQT